MAATGIKHEFYLFRHGETDWNAIGRMQGSVDIPLNAHGIAQAESLRAFFDQVCLDPKFTSRDVLIQSVVSSGLQRAHETARIATRLSEAEGARIRKDPRLAETYLGQAEGLTRDELVTKFGPDAWFSWIGLGPDHWEAKFPDGETKGEVRDRALAALEDLVRESVADPRGGRIWMIATHGGLLRRLLHHFHPTEQVAIDVVNCAVFKFVYEGGSWTVDKMPTFVPQGPASAI